MSKKHVIVIGAGIVGVSCALWAQRKGHQITLVDHDEPGSGASFGNACTIADYGCIPVNNPGLIRNLPRMIFSKESPLSVDFGYAFSNPRWMFSFLNHCRASRVNHTIDALGRLLQSTYQGLDPLVKITRSEHLFNTLGCMYVYNTRQAFDKASASNRKRKENGAHFETLDNKEIHQLESGLITEFYRGLLFADARQTINPKSLVDRYFEHLIANGGKFINAKAARLTNTGSSVTLEGGQEITGDKVVIAAGAFSGRIGNAGMEALPLDTERGYHIQFEGRQSLLNRPVAWAEAGLYATPTDSGLRFAGTVEIAGLDKPANGKKINYLVSRAREMFNLEEQPQQTWLGFRPTMPDALPVIGSSKNSPNILCAFGHQHIGLTLAGITGKLIAELLDEQSPSINLDAFSPDRFG